MVKKIGRNSKINKVIIFYEDGSSVGVVRPFFTSVRIDSKSFCTWRNNRK